MQLTRREKHVLIVAAIIAILFVIIRPSYETVREWEYLSLWIIVAPIGLYIATDPERKKGLDSNNDGSACDSLR